MPIQRPLPRSISVIAPIYNERENIADLVRQIHQALASRPDPYEIVLVDDGSNDGSRELILDLAGRDTALRVVELRRNFGQTAAIQAGIDHASGEILVLLDADLQNDPADIPRMLDRLEEGYDLVCGWRRQRHDRWCTRRLPSLIANWLIARITRVPVHDLGCTLKVMRREVAIELELVGEMHRFIPILAHRRGARCTEVETHHRPRRFGQSKYGLRRIPRVLLDLITVKFLLDYFSSPMKFFGAFGLACTALSCLTALATVGMKLISGVDMTGNPMLLLTVFLGLASLQLLSLGVLGEMNVRMYYEGSSKRPYAVGATAGFNDVVRESARKVA